MRDHLKLLGILNIIWGSIAILIGLIVLLAFGGIAGILIAAGVPRGENGFPDGIFAAPLIAVIAIAILLLLCLVSLPSLIGGIGLVRLQGWARPLMIVVSVLHLFYFPVGTALGVYGIWVLFHPDVKATLAAGNLAVPVGFKPPDAI
jgi:hypothetical protein